MTKNFKSVLQLSDSMTHEEKYTKIVNALGYENVKECIPFSLTEIKKAIQKDEHLNNLPLSKWDMTAGFIFRGQRGVIRAGSLLTRLYSCIGVNTYSASDGVCILKQCARMWASEGQGGVISL